MPKALPWSGFSPVKEIDIAEFVESTVGTAAVGVVGYSLKAAEEERLAHYVEVDTERIEQLHAAFGGELARLGIVSLGGERVVENLAPAGAGEHVADGAAEVVGSVNRCLVRQTRMEARIHRYLVVVVDTQEVFDHIAGAANIYAVGRHAEDEVLAIALALYLEGVEDSVDGVMMEVGTYQTAEVAILHYHLVGSHHCRIIVGHGAYKASAGELADKACGIAHGIFAAVGVDAALEAER